MDLRTLLWLHILIIIITITTSIAGKRKKPGSKTHVTHVVVDRTSPKSLTHDIISNSVTNTVSKEKNYGIYSKRRLKGKRLTVKGLRRLIQKRKKILNEKKRRRVLKRLRKELAMLKSLMRNSRKKCKSSQGCGRNECCIKFTQKGYGRCKKRPKLNQRCKPALMPGIDIECPCRIGLTCAPFKKSKSGNIKFHCEALKYIDEEIEAYSVTGLGRYKR
ncbi:uncharacterized protein LOC116305377 [Actinia tenebrosa]|uniref:Uncharacterized protein LOC116305377 n=1 Tax=Actinia tenebrosa TaxID=6105 RepID=A0A6P8IVK4_ACTTE|nr:uncharacterized protein LOC116305377 [Actinia tenebrosa]XP_031571133.1 uncharacterized protein LOC116305377 [Actinia tenebrosa]XP_031571134.1 uncharacterized protein LOC116305377 [Actinia tenebrosa]